MASMSWALSLIALLTGLVAGGVFAFFGVPIPAPPELAGILGIIGIFLGYQLVGYLDVGVDLIAVLGI